tara:strand:- start:316 stop:546 length:231 start_codon:yes stop_codon:yes gene_type:complete
MGEIEMYKATINGWDEKRSYLILKKVFGYLSNGGVNERYEVVKRWSAQGYGTDGIFTNSLKGVEYTKNELQNLIKI